MHMTLLVKFATIQNKHHDHVVLSLAPKANLHYFVELTVINQFQALYA